MLRRFGRERAGAFAIMFAMVIVPVILALGMAVDYSFALNSRSKLQNALDAAVLAATSSLSAVSDDEEISQLIGTMVAANMNMPADLVSISVGVDQGSRAITVDGVVDQRTYLLPIVGIGSVNVAATTRAVLGRAYIELALVLDNSGSMEGTRITRLRSAARDMARTVLDLGYNPGDTRVALVPFAGAVNVGSVNASQPWIDQQGLSPIHSENFVSAANRLGLYDAMSNVDWAGRVEARPAPHDVTDSVPNAANPATLFVPAFAPDEPDKNAIYYNNYLADSPAACPALEGGASDLTRQKRTCKYAGVEPNQALYAGTRKGPNFICDSQPITPLTANATTITTAINQMQPYGGTNIHEGVMWGWRVLSPGEPFSEGRAYDDKRNTKIIVLMSDGENQFIGWPHGVNGSVYSAYGYSNSGRLGTDSSDSAVLKQAMDARTELACTNVKAAGIEIFTVAWHVTDAPTIAMLRDCATRPDMAAVAETDAELATVFEQIGKKIGQLRLVH